MKLLYLLGFLCLVAAGSNKKRFDEEDYYKRNKHKKIRIAGGTEAHIQEMPYMATFIKKGPRYQSGLDRLICTAVIIQPFWALMASTCLEDIHTTDPNFLKSGNYVIRSNTAFFDGSSDIYRDHKIVDYYTKHLFWDLDYDTRRSYPMGANLGLVKVETEFNGEHEQPIKIVSKNYQYNVGSSAFQAGWGATEVSHGQPSVRLMVANTRLTDYEKCRRFYKYVPKETIYVFDGMVCTFAHGERPCLGDAGGPLVQDGKLIGILGYDKPCGITKWPDVYTKISNFVSWIEDTVFNETKRKIIY